MIFASPMNAWHEEVYPRIVAGIDFRYEIDNYVLFRSVLRCRML
jgi:hypothetical protein